MTESRGPGRPLDRSRDEVILAATMELFGEVGWEKLTVADVAKRARVGLSTIYRRWDGKAQLVAAALATTLVGSADGVDQEQAVPDEVLEAIAATLAGDRARFFPGLIAVMHTDDDTADAIRSTTIEPNRSRLQEHIAERLGSRAEPDLVALLADLGPAILVYRTIVLGEPPKPGASAQLTDVLDRLITSYQQP